MARDGRPTKQRCLRGEAPRAKLSEERRQDSDLTMELGVPYCVTSDESSGLLSHASPCQSRPSVCSSENIPHSFSTPPSWQTSPCVPWQPARQAKLRLAITAHPPGSEGKRLVALRRSDWLCLSQLMDGFLGTCLSGRGSR